MWAERGANTYGDWRGPPTNPAARGWDRRGGTPPRAPLAAGAAGVEGGGTRAAPHPASGTDLTGNRGGPPGGRVGTAWLTRRHHRARGPGPESAERPLPPGRATQRRRPATAARGAPAGDTGTRGPPPSRNAAARADQGAAAGGPAERGAHTQGRGGPGPAGGEQAAEETRQGGPHRPTGCGAPGRRRQGAGEETGLPRGEGRGGPKRQTRGEAGKKTREASRLRQGARGVSPPKGLRAQGRSRGTRNGDCLLSKAPSASRGPAPTAGGATAARQTPFFSILDPAIRTGPWPPRRGEGRPPSSPLSSQHKPPGPARGPRPAWDAPQHGPSPAPDPARAARRRLRARHRAQEARKRDTPRDGRRRPPSSPPHARDGGEPRNAHAGVPETAAPPRRDAGPARRDPPPTRRGEARPLVRQNGVGPLQAKEGPRAQHDNTTCDAKSLTRFRRGGGWGVRYPKAPSRIAREGFLTEGASPPTPPGTPAGPARAQGPAHGGRQARGGGSGRRVQEGLCPSHTRAAASVRDRGRHHSGVPAAGPGQEREATTPTRPRAPDRRPGAPQEHHREPGDTRSHAPRGARDAAGEWPSPPRGGPPKETATEGKSGVSAASTRPRNPIPSPQGGRQGSEVGPGSAPLPNFHAPPPGGRAGRGARGRSEKSGPIRHECPSLVRHGLGPARESATSPHRSSQKASTPSVPGQEGQGAWGKPGGRGWQGPRASLTTQAQQTGECSLRGQHTEHKPGPTRTGPWHTPRSSFPRGNRDGKARLRLAVREPHRTADRQRVPTLLVVQSAESGLNNDGSRRRGSIHGSRGPPGREARPHATQHDRHHPQTFLKYL
ncbi:collagen alpha-1(I) chain-like [Phyllostomus discolor]|uniref:Collagen alpha-1(I) chain-like n=1 Tax=Phyllostomus discolor TaxID=89673 RepID=A0A6J2N5S2_9CHIR|nr:collagen alpha-1(I) chain-like [Phyllostomus discolor]